MTFAHAPAPRLLVVADDERLRRLLWQFLPPPEFAVIALEDDTHFETSLERYMPDVVILDSAWRGDAFALCSALRQHPRWHNTFILMILREPDQTEQALAMGVNEIVREPLAAALLHHRIYRLIYQRQQQQSAEQLAQMLVATRANEQALSESEGNLRKMFDIVTDTVFLVGLDYVIQYISPGFEQLMGWRVNAWLNKPFTPLIYFDDLPLAMAMVEEVVNSRQGQLFELRVNRADGTVGWTELSLRPHFKDEKVVGLWGMAHDISSRKQAEQAENVQRIFAEGLRESAAALNASLELDDVLDRILQQVRRVIPSDAANIMLIDDQIVRVVRSSGYNPEVREKVLSTRFNLTEVDNLMEMYRNGLPFRIYDTQQFAGWVDLELSRWVRSYLGVPIQIDGEIIGFISLDSEVVGWFTEQQEAQLLSFANQAAVAIRNANLYASMRAQAAELEMRVEERTRELETERENLQLILDTMSEGVIYIEYGKLRYVNKAFADMLGYNVDDEWPALESMVALDAEAMQAFVTGIGKGLRESEYWSGELILRRRDGTTFDAALNAQGVRNSAGQVDRLVGVVRNISQEKALQAQKARFVADASHELRTPITNLQTRLFLMKRTPERMPEHIDMLTRISDRMMRLVRQLLDLSRFERGAISLHRSQMILQPLIEQIIEIQDAEAELKGLTLTAELSPSLLVLFVDTDRLEQVLTNLIMNAITYTPAGGKITIRAFPDPTEPAAVIEVEDNGIGISADHLKQIFQPFFRVNNTYEGNGLGLSITQQIIEMHEGKITARSEPGRGTCFTVHLPLYDAGLQTDAEEQDQNALHSS